MILYNENDKRKIIMDYYMNKRRRVDSFSNSSYKNVYLHSSSCVDEIHLYFNSEKNDFKFVSKGCAIFLSSSEIFIERLLEIGIGNKDKLIFIYKKMIEKKDKLLNEEIEILGKLIIFENVSKHLNRKECALIIANALKEI